MTPEPSTGRDSNAELELVDIGCERDGRVLFRGLNQAVASGDILQVQGPNGSGKTSLLRILTGIATDYAGHIRWRGGDLRGRNRYEYRADLLYMGHAPAVKRALSPEENLAFYTGLGRAADSRAAVWDALARVGLAGYEDLPCFRLSAGQLRRVALARLYLSAAQLWILDEPFTAIDYQGVEQLRGRFREHVSAGGMLILTTHQDPGLDGVKRLHIPDYAGEEH